jgi:hypothetical protein
MESHERHYELLWGGAARTHRRAPSTPRWW